MEQGVDGLRLNPGNIGARKYVEEVVKAASERKIPIRIGVNAGSLEKDLLQKYNGPTAEGMVESRAAPHSNSRRSRQLSEIKISLKASDPLMMIEAYRMLADQVDYPFHLGVTEAGHAGQSARSSPRWVWGRCWPKASATRSGFRWPLIRSRKCASGIEILKALELRRKRTNVRCLPVVRPRRRRSGRRWQKRSKNECRPTAI